MKTVEKIVIAHQIQGGASMAQRTLNAKWCQYDTKYIKCQVASVIDVVGVVMASAILASLDLWCRIILAPPGLWRHMCHIGITWLGAILEPPGLWVLYMP